MNKSEEQIELKVEGEQNKEYVTCGWRRAWIMWDLNNGHAWNKNDPGIGYMWVFKTRKDAMEHRKYQHKLKYGARLSMPFKIEGTRERF